MILTTTQSAWNDARRPLHADWISAPTARRSDISAESLIDGKQGLLSLHEPLGPKMHYMVQCEIRYSRCSLTLFGLPASIQRLME